MGSPAADPLRIRYDKTIPTLEAMTRTDGEICCAIPTLWAESITKSPAQDRTSGELWKMRRFYKCRRILIFGGKQQRHIYMRPLDADRRVVPQNAPFMRRRVIVGRLVEKICR